MSSMDVYLKKLKSARAHIRDAAALDVCRALILKECEDSEVGAAISEIKIAFPRLGVEARGMAVDVLIGGMSDDEFHNFLWTELGYSYRKLCSSHGYLAKILHMICQGEVGEVGEVAKMGDYYDIEKQFKLAFELLKSVDSAVLK